MWWAKSSPTVEIGLTDLQKMGRGGGSCPPAPFVFTALCTSRALRTLKSAVSSVFHFKAIWSVRENAFRHGKTQI